MYTDNSRMKPGQIPGSAAVGERACAQEILYSMYIHEVAQWGKIKVWFPEDPLF